MSFQGLPNRLRRVSGSKTEAILSRRSRTDAQSARMEPLRPGKNGDRGRTAAGNRWVVDAVLWLARTAAPWRELPPEPGNRRTVHCRFRRRTHSGIWENLFNASSAEPDFEYVLVGAMICKSHADASGAKGDRGSRNRSLKRRPDPENTSSRRRARPADPLPDHTRTMGWRLAGAVADRGIDRGRSRHGRRSLRCRSGDAFATA